MGGKYKLHANKASPTHTRRHTLQAWDLNPCSSSCEVLLLLTVSLQVQQQSTNSVMFFANFLSLNFNVNNN